MKLACISDTHTFHRKVTIPKCDILVHSGDILGSGMERDAMLDFDKWGKELLDNGTVSTALVVTAGNHDVLWDKYQLRYKDLVILEPNILKHWHMLLNTAKTIAGIKFYGLPQQKEFCNWGFNVAEVRMCEYTSKIPKDTEVLITHGPAYGILDMTQDGRYVGDRSLRAVLLGHKSLKLMVHGHIHWAYGQEKLRANDGHSITIVNAATCTERYQPTNPPVLIEL